MIEESFRYYNTFYDVFVKFDRPLPKIVVVFLKLFLKLFKALWLDRLLKFLIKYYVNKKYYTNSEISFFTFTKNQFLIKEKLIQYGFNFPSYNFGINEISIDTSLPNYNISNKLLFLAAFMQPNLFFRSLQNSNSDKVLSKNALRIWKLVGSKAVFELLIKNRKVVVKFNDHSPYDVLLFDLLQINGIKSVYMQHAPVSNRFPPLYHNLNVLFSVDSLEKYRKYDDSVSVFKLFDIRFPERPKFNSCSDNTVLICPNLLDKIDIVKKTGLKLLKSGYKVTIRPHPRDKRSWNVDGLLISANNEIWFDLYNNRNVISNESAVALEAIYFNNFFYKASYFSENLDNYGFIRNGLILLDYENEDDLISDLVNKVVSFDVEKINHYLGDIHIRDEKILELKDIIAELRG